MGLCQKCHEFIPPDFMMENAMCAFCKKETYIIFNNEGVCFHKQDVVTDYKILLSELKDAQSIKDAFVKTVIRAEGLKA